MRHPMKRIHAEAKPAVAKRDQPSAPRWPSYTGLSQVVGTSPSGRVTVYVDPSLGNPALQNAHDLMNDADRVVVANDALFGTTGGAVSVIIFALGGVTDGTGGGTRQITQGSIAGSGQSVPLTGTIDQLHALGGKLYFRAGDKLWSTDGATTQRFDTFLPPPVPVTVSTSVQR